MAVEMPAGELTGTNVAYKTLATETRSGVVIWDERFRGQGLKDRVLLRRVAVDLPRYLREAAAFVLFLLLIIFITTAVPAFGREKDVHQYGAGLIVNVPLPEPEVAQAVEEVAENTIIRGTKEYNKDEYVAGAVAVASTPVFPAWTESGKVFYKVRQQALDPRNFKDGGDVGTLAVRYVVQPQGDRNTILRIDAVFVEDFRRTVHLSDGSVESSEYRDIHDRLEAAELMKKETAAALEAKQERLAKQSSSKGGEAVLRSDRSSESESASTSAATNSESVAGESANGPAIPVSPPPGFVYAPPADPPQSGAMRQTSATYESGESLEKHVAELRRQLERLVKKPGAPLKSAPFHTASTLKSMEPGAEVLILITTPYWYGVETHDGQHGWVRRDQLEQMQ
jgi:hypothetical protein